ncbi:MAG: ABC transporter ATP-binding protein, partial [Oscillospiraceae bacterium]|nr:ABC transporter ATP-binding protein [Oscillospiraceae bacterium]
GPEFIVCDEPISALDVSIQSQIVNMLEDMQAEYRLTYLFIAHDISVVRHISNRMGVMYLGKLIELAPSGDIHRDPLHPYTRSLLSAVPTPDPKKSRMMARVALEGDIPSPINPPSGCRFRTRCPLAEARCADEEPAFKHYGQGHYAACHMI